METFAGHNAVIPQRMTGNEAITDECGNKVYYVDEEIRLRLEARLIYCIVADFKILPV